MEIDDQEILRKIKKNKKHFEIVYSKYNGKIRKYIYYRVSDDIIADDLTSITFSKAFKSIDSFKWQGVTILAWLYRIARNTIIDYYRKTAKSKEIRLDESYEIDAKDKSVEDKSNALFNQEILHNVLDTLDEKERKIVYLKFFDGDTNKVISDITELSETNVSTIIHRTIAKIKKKLEKTNIVC